MGRERLLLAALIGATACAPSSRAPARAGDLDAALDAWIGEGGDPSPARSATLAGQPARSTGPRAPVEVGPTTLRAPSAPPSRPRRAQRVDVSFQSADMTSAFQLLADAGRFNLVMEDGLTGHVSATLRGVDPFDALVSLAEANGATVAYEGQIVVVKKGGVTSR